MDKILEIMEDLQLVDYYRILRPEKRVYTWRKKPFETRPPRFHA